MSDEVYRQIAETIDRGTQTAPKADGEISMAFLSYLKLLYTPEQAEVVRHLNMGTRMTPVETVAEAAGMPKEYTGQLLESLAAKARLLGFGGSFAIPPIPLLLNHHQFYTEMREDDRKAAELYQQFFIKEGYYKYYEGSAKGTPFMRTISVRRTLQSEQRILDSEEAHRVVDGVSHLRLVPCPCRTRTEKLNIRECKDKYPIGYCIMMEMSAIYFEHAGLGEPVTAEGAKLYIDEMQDLGLVAITDNYSSPDHAVMCLCCECCCSVLRGTLQWENPDALAPANFVAESSEDCIMCGECIDRCVFGALFLGEEQEMAVVNPDKCMGCGVCTIACPTDALRLKRVERALPFDNPRELFKTVARENRE